MKKKQRERHLLECFLRSAGIEPLSIVDRERPDFMLSFPDGEVGVEVTELLKTDHPDAPPERAQESIADQIIRKAQQLYEQKGGLPVNVSVIFNPGNDLRKALRDELADAIASLIQIQSIKDGETFRWDSKERGVQLPNPVSYIQALGVPSLDYAHWTVPRAGWVAPLTSEALSERISAKAAKLTTYQNSARRVWLIVVTDRTRPSQMFEHRGSFDSSALKHPFERAYYYSYPDNSILVLGHSSKKS